MKKWMFTYNFTRFFKLPISEGKVPSIWVLAISLYVSVGVLLVLVLALWCWWCWCWCWWCWCWWTLSQWHTKWRRGRLPSIVSVEPNPRCTLQARKIKRSLKRGYKKHQENPTPNSSKPKRTSEAPLQEKKKNRVPGASWKVFFKFSTRHFPQSSMSSKL